MLKQTILSILAVIAVTISGCSKKVEGAENAESSGGQKALAVSSAALLTDGKSVSGGPDLVLRGTIYTGDPDLPIAGEISIEDGKIIDVLPPGKTSKSGKRTILLGGATAFPGFTDAHAHLTGIGFREMTLNLEGTASVADLVAKVTAAAVNLQRGDVLYGRGWIETGWPEGRFPNALDLDQISTKNAILLERADGHAMVVNSLALSHANIKSDTADPDGGKIERDSTGKATGMLIDNAMSLVTVLMQSPSEDQRLEAIKKGAEVYARYGWTGLHNMSVEAGDADLMVRLEERGELPIRVYNALVPEALDDLIARKIWSVNDGKVETRAVKFYVDGALGSRGAALAQPYADDPNSKGLLLISEQDAKAAWQKALDNGIQVTTHAIGDRGNALVLQWYTDVLRKFNNQDYPRWRIEHAQIINPDDYHQFYDLGVIASMQPSHAIGDLHFAPDRLGMDRLNGAYAWRSLMDADAIIVGGSDAPVERGDPMVEFYAAVTREDLKGFTGPGWHPEEVLTRDEALRIFTYNPAIASYNEDRLGQLKVGRKADISIFSANIMTIEADQIPLTKAVMTIVDGEIVFEGK